MTNPNRLISICICTHKRPAGLRLALQSILALHIPLDHAIEVIVVDNESTPSASAVVDSFMEKFPTTSIQYIHEPRSGVSHARNKCLDSANGDLLAFFDDDEQVEPRWLIELLACMESTQADAVFGPVQPAFETTPSSWVLATGLHQRRRFSTGTVLPWRETPTSNVAMRRSMLEGGHRFSAEFARTGGEDSLFFATAQARGRKLVWCDEAVVHETVPVHRMERAWILHRAFMGGRTYVRLQARLGHPLPYTTFALRGLAGSVVEMMKMAVYYLRGDVRHAHHLCRLYGHLGKIAARFYSRGPYAGGS